MPVDGQDGAGVVYVVGEFAFEIFWRTAVEQIATARVLEIKKINK